jgi:hypothetical protein
MKTALPALLLALASCQVLSDPSGNATNPATGQTVQGGSTAPSDQVKALQAIGSAGTTASQIGAAMGNPAVAGAGAAVATLAEAVTNATRSSSTPRFDPSKRFEYADVYVSLGDPEGMRSLVPYLMKQEEWMLIQCEMMTPTYKHYRFQRISNGEGRAMPSVDVFKPRNNNR